RRRAGGIRRYVGRGAPPERVAGTVCGLVFPGQKECACRVVQSAASPLEDPYLDPKSGVLINRFGIQDADLLSDLEATYTRIRARQRLHNLPMTPSGFQAVHKH